jgi:hypothetical protein
MSMEDFLPAHLKGAYNAAADGVMPLIGLVNRGATEGRWFVYTGLDMARRLEIAESDIVDFDRLAPHESPFGRLGGTRILVKKNAEIHLSRAFAQQESTGDEFDLDIRMPQGGLSVAKDDCEGTEPGTTCLAECAGDTNIPCTDNCTIGCPQPTAHTCATDCGPTCHDTCATCKQATCHTCNTKCNQHTCQTCQTNCHQQTCQTCNQGTCQTCNTQCNQKTCQTCHTQCGTCPGDTCAACTHVTCGHQPGCIPV